MDTLKLFTEIESYIEETFIDYEHTFIKSPKAIHDSVLETNYFLPHEIAFLDLPIIQRLRHISQTDVASYVFPSANHNRFEHTLGVATIAGKFVEALFQRNNCLLEGIEKNFVKYHCRIAAILHDSGHGVFSHLSEQVYSYAFDDIRKERRFLGASPHEIMSYMIATSKPMQKFNKDVIKGQYKIDIDLKLVGDIIIGFSEERPKEAFMVEIINGAFDADKLDYMLRDSHSTGIHMSIDLSRLFYTLDIVKDKEKLRLSIDISGVIALEQIVFNKMTLFTTIYHHHKVRATGCLLKSIFKNNKEFISPIDYLKYTDNDIWASSEIKRKTIMENLKKRNIPKRALVISSRTIETNLENLDNIMSLTEEINYVIEIEQLIAEKVKEKYEVDISDAIWIDIPSGPKFKEAKTCVIKNHSMNSPYLTLNQVFPIDEWVRAFSQNKWKAYVFTMPKYCNIVSEVSKEIFEKLFNIEFNEYALSICKLPT